jgi:release factor glutamine methyltransferase
LSSGSDGLQDIRQIVVDASARLHSGGWLLIEHGFDQAELVRQLLCQAGFASIQSRHDLNGIERCSGGRTAKNQ